MATYDFDWDGPKAVANLLKHRISFELAATVFRDPLALTVFDDEHSEDEERWVARAGRKRIAFGGDSHLCA